MHGLWCRWLTGWGGCIGMLGMCVNEAWMTRMVVFMVVCMRMVNAKLWIVEGHIFSKNFRVVHDANDNVHVRFRRLQNGLQLGCVEVTSEIVGWWWRWLLLYLQFDAWRNSLKKKKKGGARKKKKIAKNLFTVNDSEDPAVYFDLRRDREVFKADMLAWRLFYLLTDEKHSLWDAGRCRDTEGWG